MRIERGHLMKNSKYEKRRHSPSPIHHSMGSSQGMREAYQDERYSGRPMPHDSRFSTPLKKKIHRESDDRYERGPSPGLRIMHHPDMARPENRTALHRTGMQPHSSSVSNIPNQPHRNHGPMPQHDRIDHYDMHRSHPSPTSIMPTDHSKRPPPSMKQPFKDSRQERYRSPSPEGRYPSPRDKHYYGSLHERFSSVNSEPPIKYSIEELETITVDVLPSSVGSPRSRRHINSQSGGKMVRREEKGPRSMFDRDEIRQASRDMREDAFYEKRPSDALYGSMSVVKSVGKYKVRQKFDTHSAPFHSSRGGSPGERWPEDQRREGMSMDRDHREYERTGKKRFVDSRSKSGDQDFRSGKYSRDVSRERPEYPSPSHRMTSPDYRNNMPPIHRKEGMIQDARERLTARRGMKPHASRSDSRGRYPSELEKHYSDGFSSRTDKQYSGHRSPEPHQWRPKHHRSESRERMPSYSHSVEKYPSKTWPEKRDLSPRNPGFHVETERYMESDSYRGRGGPRPFRPREQRGRGSFQSRSFRGGYRSSTSARGRGAPRRGRYSPGVWERDL